MRDAYADALAKSGRYRQPIRMGLLMLVTMLAVLPAVSAQEEAPLAPDFEVLDLDGQTVRFSDYAGRVVIVNFWATWCFPCRFEMPLLHQLYRRFEARGLVVLAVAVDDEHENIARYQAKHGFTFPILHDAAGVAKQAYRTSSVPQTFIVDRSGRLVVFEDPVSGEKSTMIDDPMVWRGDPIVQLLEDLLDT